MHVASKVYFTLVFLILHSLAKGQIYVSSTNSKLYLFIDELANEKIININSCIKPYSRKQICNWLVQAKEKRQQLNQRQQNTLDFYMADYCKETIAKTENKIRKNLFYYNNDSFNFTINPVYGLVGIYNKNLNYHRWGGLELYGSKENLDIHFKLYDNYENEQLVTRNLISPNQGALYKSGSGLSGEYSRMLGSICYNGKWFSVGIARNNAIWGNAYNGSIILSNKAPTYNRLNLNIKPVKWLELNYSHGFLISDVIDSSKMYLAGAKGRRIFVPKFIASNMLSVRPIKHMIFSLGNSVIYSDQINVGFLIPFMFYKAIDHQSYYGIGNYGGQNSQMFFDLSLRQLKRFHFYSTLFVDEISFSRMLDQNTHSNFLAFKYGFRWSNILNRNFDLIIEKTRVNPIVYQHFVNTTTYESNSYNLGSMLGNNASDLYIQLGFNPIKNVEFSIDYNRVLKGPQYEYTGTNGSGLGVPYLQNVIYSLNDFGFKAVYEPFNDVNFIAKVHYSVATGDLNYIKKELNPTGLSSQLGFNISF